MADAKNALQKMLIEYPARRDTQEAAFREIKFGEDGYFQRAVNAVTSMLEPILEAKLTGDQAGRSLMELVSMLMRADQKDVTNENVELLIVKSANDFYSFQELKYLASIPLFLSHLPALREWRQRVDLGVALLHKSSLGRPSPYPRRT